MNIYADQSAVTLNLPFEDEQGSPITPVSVSYRVLGEDNTQLVEPTAIVLTTGQVSAEITISSAINTLSGARVGLRNVEVTIQTASGTVIVNRRYIIEAANIIEFGVNSFQTYSEALLEAAYMTDVQQWSSEDEKRQRSALIEAYFNLRKLKFKIKRDIPNQSSMLFNQHYGSYESVSLIDLTTEELNDLEPELMVGLRKAQIAEADFLLGGESVDDKRSSGLLSESVGESSQMFRSGKPLVLPVSRKALSHLHGFIDWSIKTAR